MKKLRNLMQRLRRRLNMFSRSDLDNEWNDGFCAGCRDAGVARGRGGRFVSIANHGHRDMVARSIVQTPEGTLQFTLHESRRDHR